MDVSNAFFTPSKDTFYILHDPIRGSIAPINCTNSSSGSIISQVWEKQPDSHLSGQDAGKNSRFTITTSKFWIQTAFLPSLNCYMTGAVALEELNYQMRQNIARILVIVFSVYSVSFAVLAADNTQLYQSLPKAQRDHHLYPEGKNKKDQSPSSDRRLP